MKKRKKIIGTAFITCCLLLQVGLSYGGENKVRMLVMYTQAALNGGSSSKMYTAINKSVQDINTSFAISEVGHTVELAGILQLKTTTFSEKNCYFTMLNELKQAGYGWPDDVGKLRNKYKADVVVLVVNDNSRCGLADNVLGADHAFIVVNYDCMVNNWSLARELGYLYQCGNNENQLESEGAVFNKNGNTNKAFGYIYNDYNNSRNNFSTIMGYTDEAKSYIYDDWNLKPFWSNPNVFWYSGSEYIQIGDATHNNVAVMTNTVFTLVNYRTMDPTVTIDDETVNSYEYISSIASETLYLKNFIIKSNGNLDAVSGTIVSLLPGFSTEKDATVTIRTDKGINTGTLPQPSPMRMATNIKNVTATTNINAQSSPSLLPPVSGNGIKVYPNAFNDKVSIKYTLDKDQPVNLMFYDIAGKQIGQSIIDTPQTAGEHEFIFDGSTLSKGIYIYKLTIDGAINTGKIIKEK